jgi:hypothetical protein
MSQGSFSAKRIQVNFTLASGQFGADLGNTKIVSGLRVACNIKKSGQPAKNACRLQIFGMLPADMSQLSTLGYAPLAVRKNLVQVMAGDSDGLTSVFQGEITGAWVNYHKPPDLNFEVHAVTGYYPALAPALPTSLPGGIQATTLFQKLARDMGYAFKNNGLDAIIQNPYLSGSAYKQFVDLGKSLGCEFGIDDGEVFVCPKGVARSSLVAYTSPTTGMKEYPTFNRKGIEVEMLFNPAATLGGRLQISGSLVTQANGIWRIHGLEHNLVSKDQHRGTWHTRVMAAKEGA